MVGIYFTTLGWYLEKSAWKINQMWGIENGFYSKSNSNSLGNAKDWESKLLFKGYSADLNPKVGDIAWWESNVDGNSGANGHVAFVNEVRDGGNTVVITEYNFLSLNAYESPERVLQRYGAAQNSRKFPSSFIHVQTKRQ